MVFSSITPYLDPVNWQHQQQEQQQQQLDLIGSSNVNNTTSTDQSHHQLLSTVLSAASRSQPQPTTHDPVLLSSAGGGGGPMAGAGCSSSIRPGSMAERARMANIPMPEAALKCPRCESSNTKFCYFNNYSLSQPRHFCKTCRRYWTRGGSLRNVPVGGGCRRNKRSKGSAGGGSSSKSTASCSSDPSTSTTTTTTSSSATSTAPSIMNNRASIMADILGLTSQVSPLRLMPPLTSLSHHHDHYGGGGDVLGLNYSAISAAAAPLSDHQMTFQLGGMSSCFNVLGAAGGSSSSCLLSTPQLPNSHFSSMGGFDLTTLYPFEVSVDQMPPSTFSHVLGPRMMNSGTVDMQALAGGQVKMEENHPELNLPRQFLALQANDQQYWGAAAAGHGHGLGGGRGGSNSSTGGGSSWTEIPGVNASCSSTSHHAL